MPLKLVFCAVSGEYTTEEGRDLVRFVPTQKEVLCLSRYLHGVWVPHALQQEATAPCFLPRRVKDEAWLEY